MRFRLSPDNTLAIGVTALADNDEKAVPVELMVSRQQGAEDEDAYERVLTDAMAGDQTMFARQTTSKKRGASSIRFSTTLRPSTLTISGNVGPGRSRSRDAPGRLGKSRRRKRPGVILSGAYVILSGGAQRRSRRSA